MVTREKVSLETLAIGLDNLNEYIKVELPKAFVKRRKPKVMMEVSKRTNVTFGKKGQNHKFKQRFSSAFGVSAGKDGTVHLDKET